MKIGIVVGTNEPEIVWNAFRFCNTALKAKHDVKVFLMNKGVEIEDIKDETFNVEDQLGTFLKNKGELFACGTCLKLRQKESIPICPTSTMQNLLKIVEESDKVLTFG